MKWKMQETSFSCGPSALRNCLLKFGQKHSEKKIRILAGTSKKRGTDEKGIMNAMDALWIEHKEHESRSADVFGRKLLKALKNGSTCIVLTDSFQHWVAALNYEKRRIELVDTNFREGKKPIHQKIRLKDFKVLSCNFDRFNLKTVFYFLEIFPPK
jgi:ABC-type bacteriocin/lantibiotic exporter with double-glycine peptidase domain